MTKVYCMCCKKFIQEAVFGCDNALCDDCVEKLNALKGKGCNTISLKDIQAIRESLKDIDIITKASPTAKGIYPKT